MRHFTPIDFLQEASLGGRRKRRPLRTQRSHHRFARLPHRGWPAPGGSQGGHAWRWDSVRLCARRRLPLAVPSVRESGGSGPVASGSVEVVTQELPSGRSVRPGRGGSSRRLRSRAHRLPANAHSFQAPRGSERARGAQGGAVSAWLQLRDSTVGFAAAARRSGRLAAAQIPSSFGAQWRRQ